MITVIKTNRVGKSTKVNRIKLIPKARLWSGMRRLDTSSAVKTIFGKR